MDADEGPLERPSRPSAPVGGGPVRKISWILAAAALVLAVAYLLTGLRPAAQDAGEEVATLPAEDGETPGHAPLDTLVTPADLPGFETEHLTNAQRLWLYHHAHREQCACECGMTVAQCRVEDPTCPESPGRAVELVRAAEEAVPGG